MREESVRDMVFVKNHYAEASLIPQRTIQGAMLYAVYEPRSGRYIGPTAFREDTAWKWAAERIRKSQHVGQ